MAVYMIIEVQIKDRQKYSEYTEKVPEIITKYEGSYLTRGGKITPITGDWKPEKIVMVEFETIEQLQKCFQSTEYLRLAPLREQSTVSKAIIVDGCY